MDPNKLPAKGSVNDPVFSVLYPKLLRQLNGLAYQVSSLNDRITGLETLLSEQINASQRDAELINQSLTSFRELPRAGNSQSPTNPQLVQEVMEMKELLHSILHHVNRK